MAKRKIGRQTLAFAQPPTLHSWACCVGKKEGEGPLSDCFDQILPDDSAGESTWEKAEQTLLQNALQLALNKGGLRIEDLDFFCAGDLLNQCISSAYTARGQDVPYFGLYGACSTMGEGLAVASIALDGGFGSYAAAAASSHFCSAERQYRNPLEYGGQRPPTSQWTVTGAGAVLLAARGDGPFVTHATLGKVIDKGITDANNMGAAMAPAAADTIAAHFRETGRSPSFYDLVVTGDLGHLGSALLRDLLKESGISLPNHLDCGCIIFDREKQDVHAGGSGCGCCASVLTGYLLPGIRAGHWKHILFCPTGALHSPTASFQGESIPAICHAIAISGAL